MGWSPFRPTGLTHIDESRVSEGYTLVTPPGDSVYLIDIHGRPVHRWQFDGFHPGYARLLPTGTLLLRAMVRGLPPPAPVRYGEEHPPLAEHVRRMAGGATHLLEVDRDGRIAWQYENHLMHHDFARLENGRTIAVTWSELDPETELAVRGGLPRRPGEVLPPLLGDTLVEVDEHGEETWRCDIAALLDPVADPLCPLEPRWAWTHTNGISLTRAGEILFSCRNNDRVGAIDRETGALTWTWGRARHQHSPVEAANGDVLIFDNGVHRPNVPRSRVVRVERATGEIAWQWEGDPPESFFSWNVSSAEDLPNGNILVCEGTAGRLLELTAEGDIVWEWISPFEGRFRGRRSSILFRAHRYPPGHAGLRSLQL